MSINDRFAELDLNDVTATAAELNILDGVTATAAELNILDGVTSTASELNILDGVTATASELNITDGLTSTTAELNKLDMSANTLEVTTTASTAVTAGICNVEINLSSGAGVITVADLAAHQGDFFIKQIGASTAGATVTASSGTWDGTNTVVTTDAANEAILLKIDSAGNGTIIENVGTVTLS